MTQSAPSISEIGISKLYLSLQMNGRTIVSARDAQTYKPVRQEWIQWANLFRIFDIWYGTGYTGSTISVKVRGMTHSFRQLYNGNRFEIANLAIEELLEIFEVERFAYQILRRQKEMFENLRIDIDPVILAIVH